MFRSREDAAKLLGARLKTYGADNPLVLAVPRGGVPMGRVIADMLNAELDIVLVHKIGAPGHPEFAIGAVDESGRAEFSRAAEAVAPGYLQQAIDRETENMRARRKRYGRAPVEPAGRTVIVVDDGVATGSTLLAALRLLAAQHPRRLIAAIAVAPADTLARIAAAADGVACLKPPRSLRSVGEHFEDFRQVSDEEVEALLAASVAPDPSTLNE